MELKTIKQYRIAQGTLGNLSVASRLLAQACKSQEMLGRIEDVEKAYRAVGDTKRQLKQAVYDFEAAMVLAGEYPSEDVTPITARRGEKA